MNLQADIEAFLANGGEIQVLPGFSGNIAPLPPHRSPNPVPKVEKKEPVPRGARTLAPEGYYSSSTVAMILDISYDGLMSKVRRNALDHRGHALPQPIKHKGGLFFPIAEIEAVASAIYAQEKSA